MKRSLLALSILTAYARANRLNRRLERSQSKDRADLLQAIELANAHLARLQDRYAGKIETEGRPSQPS